VVLQRTAAVMMITIQEITVISDRAIETQTKILTMSRQECQRMEEDQDID